MIFVSAQFLYFALVAILVIRLPLLWLHRDIRVICLSGYFVASYFSDVQQFLPLLVFILLGYTALITIAYMPSLSRVLLPVLIALLIVLFVFLKQYAILDLIEPSSWTPHLSFFTVGLSYILFRTIHVLIDLAQGGLKRPPLLRYLNYCLFFPNFVSGPIQRFEDFDAQMERPLARLTLSALHTALTRICLGIAMILVVSSVAARIGLYEQKLYYTSITASAKNVIAMQHLLAATVCYPINLFANFAGYMHIIIGLGSLMGFNIPENFNKPYLAKNFLDLWARWHITLSEWFKFYLFNPLLKLLVQTWGSPSMAAYFGSIAFFVTFLIMGIWHGTTAMFLFYGVFLGFGAMITKTWQVALTKTLGKNRYKSLTQRDWYFQLSRGLTLSYFAVALICLWLDPHQLGSLGTWRFLCQGAVVAMALTLGFASVGILIDRLFVPLISRKSKIVVAHSDSILAMRMGLLLFIMINIIGIFGSDAPEFIYKAF